MTPRPRRSVRIVAAGPMMVEGPLSIQLPNGDVVEVDRFQVAICMCHKSSCYPLCDTSHRRLQRTSKQRTSG
ncbi:CDGSH iron-sulfur domain-containing protein [Mycobacteroides abscessus]|nr:hypothetical protein MYCMA_08900 [Mycobacteroides abscessus subsp. massiliense str. GO 06]AMU26156.1 hypothetical protein A3N96_12550 [Mycobacteroides abscessus]EHC01275.1 hypothetical protein MAB47J26_07170 [Mycobacteroides abscessus 47J26]QCO26582.1 CDGSH iron-sulfur domain-containing protein [Mycobacteroides abscessus subsp. massiliense]AMU35836.1 hypothetical protein A3N98_11745 [Mycobacteroides abscessus]